MVSGEYQGWDYHERDTSAAKSAEEYRGLYLARFRLDGSLDTTFGNKVPQDGVFRWMTPIDERNPDFQKGQSQIWGKDYVHDGADIVLDHLALPSGEILAVGQMGNDPFFHTQAVLFKVRADGSGLVSSFGDAANPGMAKLVVTNKGINTFTKVSLDAQGRILAAGMRRVSGYQNDDATTYDSRQPFVARFTADGKLDSSFGEGGIARITLPVGGNHVGGMAVQDDGRILIAGCSGLYTVVRMPPLPIATNRTPAPWLVRIPANGGSPDLQRVYDNVNLERCMGLQLSYRSCHLP